FGMARAVVPPDQVVTDGVLDSLGCSFDDFARAVVPEWLGAVFGDVEVREEVRVHEIEREFVEPVGAGETPDPLVIDFGIERVDFLGYPSPWPLHRVDLLVAAEHFRTH